MVDVLNETASLSCATRELCNHGPRRETGETPDFSREMRLVGVPAGRRQGGKRQARTGVHTSDESLKAENASERLRAVAKQLVTTAAEASLACAQLDRQLANVPVLGHQTTV